MGPLLSAVSPKVLDYNDNAVATGICLLAREVVSVRRFFIYVKGANDLTNHSPARGRGGHRPPQISLGFMLLMTLVLAAMCAGLYRASRVPAVVRDVYITLGWQAPPSDSEIERSLHVYFLLFTYTTPLILAGILSTILNVRKWLARRAGGGPWQAEGEEDSVEGHDTSRSESTSPAANRRPPSSTPSEPLTATH